MRLEKHGPTLDELVRERR